MLGIGKRNIRYVATDSAGRMKPQSLSQAIVEDKRNGFRPLCVISTLGTTNTGQVDDFVSIGHVCDEQQVWHHVDGCYGGFTNLVSSKRHFVRGIDQADSIAIDPQKHYFPFDAACAMVKRPATLMAAFSTQAEYLPNSLTDEDSPFHFRDHGPQLARRFNALKIWWVLKRLGASAFGNAIAREYELASTFADMLAQDDEFELLMEPPLGIVVFRYQPRVDMPPDEVDQLNDSVTDEVRRRGRVFQSNTRFQSRTAVRACFVSFRTTEDDLRIIIDEYRTVGRMLYES